MASLTLHPHLKRGRVANRVGIALLLFLLLVLVLSLVQGIRTLGPV